MITFTGGDIIQQECRDRVRDNRKLLPGDVFRSSAGKLQCLAVLHAVGPHWQGGGAGEERYLAETVNNILERATDDKVGYCMVQLCQQCNTTIVLICELSA